MINFASLFSQFRGGSNSLVSELLDQPDTDLDRLLDEDTFATEYKSGNNRVMSFMKYDKMQALVDYVTVVGPAQDKKKGYKFPLAACDILSSDNSSTIDYFFPNGQLYTEETVEEEVEVEEEQQIEDAEENETEEPENPPKTVIEDQLENIGQGQQPEENEKQIKNDEQKKENEEVVETKKRTVLVKKNVTKIIKKEAQPLINKLFSYFEGEVNYTLAGYVSKILTSFFGKKPQQVMKFILEEKNFDNLLNHVESRSVGEFITKIMTQESTQFLGEREQALKKILTKLSKNEEIYIISNLSACVCEIIEKVASNAKSSNPIPEYCGIFFLPQTVVKVINNVISPEQNVSVYNAPILLTYLTNAPIVLPENQTVVNEFKALLNVFVEKSIEKLKVTRNQRQTLGFGRVKIVEILSFIIKENILSTRQIVARHAQFFPTFISLLRNYEMNNILHNEFLKILTVTFSEDSNSPLLNNLFEGDYFMNFISEEAEEDLKIRAGSGKQKNRKGYIGHVISICRKIQENQTKNEKISTFASKTQFENVVQSLVNKELYEYNKNLAGFSLKKGQVQTVMFMKEEVIKEHIKFLSATPPPVYEPEPQNINIEHPDLEQNHKIDINEILREGEKDNDGETLQIEDVIEDINPKYWISHMNYEVDQLMNDL